MKCWVVTVDLIEIVIFQLLHVYHFSRWHGLHLSILGHIFHNDPILAFIRPICFRDKSRKLLTATDFYFFDVFMSSRSCSLYVLLQQLPWGSTWQNTGDTPSCLSHDDIFIIDPKKHARLGLGCTRSQFHLPPFQFSARVPFNFHFFPSKLRLA